jgi:hypothetical protein
MCGYLWHIFSYKKRQCLIGEEAEGAFENEEKKSCYIFYQNSEEALALEDATAFDINDLLGEADIYIVDKEFRWTFIQTHEKGWIGPFFCRKA